MIQSIVKFSQLEDRLDAEYYKPEYIQLRDILSKNKIKVKEAIDILSGYAFPSDWFNNQDGEPVIKMTQITNDWVVSLNGCEYLSVLKKNEFKKFIIKRNDILIALTGATIGNSAIYDSDVDSLLNQRVALIRAKNISPFYLFALFRTKYFKSYINYLCGGGARQNVSPKEIGKFPLLAENLKIKITEIVKAALKKRQLAQKKYQEAKELLEDYLKIDEADFKFQKAFSAKFSDIEDRFDPEYYQPRFLKIFKALDKSGYELKRLGDIASGVRYGTSEKVIYKAEGVPFLRVTDVDELYSIEPEKGKFISKQEANKLKQYAVKKGEIIISRTGTLGSAVYIDDNLEESIFGSYFIKVSPKSKELLPEFIAFYLNSLFGKMQTEKMASGGIQTNITIDTIKSYKIPILNKKAQEKICSLYFEALDERRKSKHLLEQAKLKVEEIVEQGAGS